jgi:CIC family chloride channel protein
LLVPAGVGLLVGFLMQRFFRGARGSGVNQTKAAVYVFDGYVPFRTVIGKFVTCALAIGSGQSLGPEDPSLQIGAGIASALGRRLKLSRDKLRLLAPVGAAAGLAAAFNAPISAVLFVIEEVIGTWSAVALGAIVLAAVSSAVVMRWFLGSEPLFHVPAYNLAHPAELFAYALLGVVGGFVSLAFLKIIAYFRPLLRDLPEWTRYLQPAIADSRSDLLDSAFLKRWGPDTFTSIRLCTINTHGKCWRFSDLPKYWRQAFRSSVARPEECLRPRYLLAR